MTNDFVKALGVWEVTLEWHSTRSPPATNNNNSTDESP
jgi:hypothetical protein